MDHYDSGGGSNITASPQWGRQLKIKEFLETRRRKKLKIKLQVELESSTTDPMAVFQGPAAADKEHTVNCFAKYTFKKSVFVKKSTLDLLIDERTSYGLFLI